MSKMFRAATHIQQCTGELILQDRNRLNVLFV